MLSGDALLVVAVLAAAVGLGATAWALLAGGAGPAAPRIGQAASWLAFAATAAATLLLLLMLVGGDFSVRYVWQHSASTDPVLRRMSALLAGQEGSFLVWGLFAGAVAGGTARRWRRSGDAGAGVVHLTTAAVALAVLALALASAPFQSFASAFPALDVQAAPVEGRGLNPVLANRWMPPHTLATFAGYALVGLAFALAACQLLRLAQGRAAEVRRWAPRVLSATRWAWLTMSAALLAGVVWAYEEMTFGWFWSWDPVEAATLSIWLVLTAALHAFGEARNGRRRLVVAPALVMSAFAAVLFASFVTRSGLHPSVHAFASGATGLWLGGALALVLVMVAVLTVAAWRAVPPKASRQPWVSWAAWLLLAAAGLITWGLAYPMVAAGVLGRATELDTGYFTMAGSLVAIGLLLLMGFGLQMARGRRRDAALTLAFFVVLTAVAAAVRPVAGLELIAAERRVTAGALEAFLGRASLLVFLPPAVYALLAVVERWWAGVAGASRRARLARTGSALAHLGAVLAITGAALATLLATTVTVAVSPATQVGVAEGVQVRITALERTEHRDATGGIVEQRETATVEVRTAAGLVAVGPATLSTYPERDMGRHARVLIRRSALVDTQVIFHGLAERQPDGLPVTVRRIPLVNLLWGGLTLFLAGMVVVLASPVGRAPAAPARPGEPARERPAPVAAGGVS